MNNNNSSSSPISTASAWLALLPEENDLLRKHALERLLECVDWEWHVIAPALAELEALAEQGEDVPQQQVPGVQHTVSLESELSALAAALASKVFFYLEEPATALRLALLSMKHNPARFMLLEEFFDFSNTTNNKHSNKSNYTNLNLTNTTFPYAVALLRAALDAYIASRREDSTVAAAAAAVTAPLYNPQQLQPLIYRSLESACAAGHYSLASGMCLEARDMQALQSVLQHAAVSKNDTQNHPVSVASSLLQYVMESVTASCPDKAFARDVMALVAVQWQTLFQPTPNTAHEPSTATAKQQKHLAISYDLVQTLQRLGDAARVAQVLHTLLVVEPSTPDEDQEAAGLTALQLVFDLVDTGDQAFCQRVADALTALLPQQSSSTQEASTSGENNPTNDNSNNNAVAAATSASNDSYFTDATMRVLTGGLASDLALSYLHKHSAADALVMDTLKRSLEERTGGSSRSSVLHNAAVVTHSYLYAGTTNDAFLRLHLDWMKKASNWYVILCLGNSCYSTICRFMVRAHACSYPFCLSHTYLV